MIQARRPMAFNQDIKAITVDPTRLEADYAVWFLRSQEGRIPVQGVKRGATVHSLHSGFVENLLVPLPPLEEQRRIVDILNREQTASVGFGAMPLTRLTS
jgi:type I restriction enzyme S subunit